MLKPVGVVLVAAGREGDAGMRPLAGFAALGER